MTGGKYVYTCIHIRFGYYNSFAYVCNYNLLPDVIMIDIHKRIELLMQKEILSASQFADKIGVQRSSISHILSGRNKPSLDFIQKVLNNFPRLESQWLIMGDGVMYKDKKQAVIFKEIPEKENSSSSEANIVHKEIKESHPLPELQDKIVEKIVILYSDKTFTEYKPS